jgi:hypothetical protein
MKPKPALKSSKAQFVLANLDNNISEKNKLMIIYLDEVLARQETENRDLKTEVAQLRKTVLRIFESK